MHAFMHCISKFKFSIQFIFMYRQSSTPGVQIRRRVCKKIWRILNLVKMIEAVVEFECELRPIPSCYALSDVLLCNTPIK